jgi:DNA-binding transcriptional LysR family regulator
VDRIDAMKVFVAALDEGSLVRAGRKLGRSPAAVSRAIAFLEDRVGAELLHRTTRSIKMSEAGERYAIACRRVLTDLDEAEITAAGERSAPRGVLTLTAPVLSGEEVLRPILDAFMDAYPTVSARLYLRDDPVNLIDEGIDIALRIAHLADSASIAIRVGEVRRVVAAAPRYLARHPRIAEPGDLAKHQIISMTHFGLDSWSFPPLPGSSVPRTVQFTPRVVINSVRGAIASAVEGRGVTRVFSYQIAEHVRDGGLQIVLGADEPPPLPVHVISPNGRLTVPKVRAFADFAVPRLRRHFARLATDAGDRGDAVQSLCARAPVEQFAFAAD